MEKITKAEDLDNSSVEKRMKERKLLLCKDITLKTIGVVISVQTGQQGREITIYALRARDDSCEENTIGK